MSKKLNVIKATIVAEFSDADGHEMDTSKGSEFRKLFADISAANDDRVVVAHCPFRPEGTTAIVFERVTRGALQRESLRWDYSAIDAKFDRLDALTSRLSAFVGSLTPYEPKLDFSDSRNSAYAALLF